MKKKILITTLFLSFIISLMFFSGCSSGNEEYFPERVTITINNYIQNAESGQYEKVFLKNLVLDEKIQFTYKPNQKDNYDIDFEKSKLNLNSVKNGDVIDVYYTCQTCELTFNGGENAVLVSGETTLILRKGQVPKNLPVFEKDGYKFEGFENFNGQPIFSDSTFHAKWAIVEYKLSLIVPEGCLIEDEKYVLENGVYVRTFNNEEFLLPSVKFDDNIFVGWYTTADESGEKVDKITSVQTKNITFYAHFNNAYYEMNFIVDGNENYGVIYEQKGSEVNAPYINPEYQRPGYGLNWYSDRECTNLYEFTVMPQGGAEIYGKWEIDTGEGIFKEGGIDTQIDNFYELATLIDYVGYNYIDNVENSPLVTITYCLPSEIKAETQKAFQVIEYNLTGGVSWTTTTDIKGNSTYQFAVGKNYKDIEASESKISQGVTACEYLGNIIKPGEKTGFYIDSLEKVQEVETTNQLIYVVQHGYKPICKSGSSAEKAFFDAKNILNSIISDDDSNYTKALKIFDYIADNIEYDYQTFEDEKETNDGSWAKYDAFYVEGVFNNKKAVCDGLSKAYSLMCNIEGIPCVQVSGNGHAWCKTKINNQWTIVDPTFGIGGRFATETTEDGKKRGGKTMVAHEHFSMTQDEKLNPADKNQNKYGSSQYKNINANYRFNYFKMKTYEYNGQIEDLVINNVNDLVNYFEYLKAEKGEFYGKCFDFLYKPDITSMFISGDQLIIKAVNKVFKKELISPELEYTETSKYMGGTHWTANFKDKVVA